ncbi:sugar (pentulose or hexulose) kinase [Anaerotaenia torta]|uniref:FGGY-family carbohydrate kinase n=1 Tax=Anaerotaenia torta TaxID=433293 RepID=UPI003D24B0C9
MKSIDKDAEIEYRPYIGDTYLMVGAPLCGGAAYELLKNFYRKVLELFRCEIPENMYEVMNQAADSVYNTKNPIVADTRFNGTRSDPRKRGRIEQLDADNFTPEDLTLGMLQGMCRELYELYQKAPKEDQGARVLIGSGNGIRKNPVLQKVIEDIFGKDLHIPIFGEEASCGAALYSLYSSGHFHSIGEVQKKVRTKRGLKL